MSEASKEEMYRPIDCGFHDQLLAFATLGAPVRLRYAGEDGAAREATGRIQDVFTRRGAEYLALAGGLELRLDRILGVEARGSEKAREDGDATV